MRTPGMNLRQLEAFVAVIDASSFSRAAVRLGLGQSTVSAHVASLEKVFGMPLFERSGRKVIPSRVGAVLLPHAREMLGGRRRAEAAMQALHEGASGELLIAASTLPATYLLPAWLAIFRASRPGVRITVRVGDSREAEALLTEGAVDLAVTGTTPQASRRILARPVAEDRLVLAVPPRHPLSSRRHCRPEDLKGIPFLQREPGSGTRTAIESALRRSGLDPARDLSIACELGSTEAVREGVKAGLGVAILPLRAVAEARRDGTLRTLPLDGFPDRRTIYLLQPVGRNLPPLARAFAEFLGKLRK